MIKMHERSHTENALQVNYRTRLVLRDRTREYDLCDYKVLDEGTETLSNGPGVMSV